MCDADRGSESCGFRPLIRSEKAVQSTKPILAKHGFPDDYRTITVIGFISVLIEHQESVLLLVMHDNAGSASALVRPIVEGAFRGLWINLPATDDQVKKFNEKDKIDLEFGELDGVGHCLRHGRLLPGLQDADLEASQQLHSRRDASDWTTFR